MPAVFIGFICLAPAAAAQGKWTQLYPSNFPDKRCDYQMVAFGQNEVLLYGGKT